MGISLTKRPIWETPYLLLIAIGAFTDGLIGLITFAQLRSDFSLCAARKIAIARQHRTEDRANSQSGGGA